MNIQGYNATTNCSCQQFSDMIKRSDQKEEIGDDATWILTSAFIIFTMQSGFGLLEAGNIFIHFTLYISVFST